MTTAALTPNQLAILESLKGEVLGAQEIVLTAKVGTTSVYNTLRALKGRGLVVEKQVRRGATAKGDRFVYRLSAKGARIFV